MPLPVVSGAQAVRAFERAGWVIARRKTSHIILKKQPPSIPSLCLTMMSWIRVLRDHSFGKRD